MPSPVIYILCPSQFGDIDITYNAIQELKLNLDHPKVNGETTVSNAATEVAAIMGENVKFRRGFLMSKSSAGVLSAYLHTSPQPGTKKTVKM